MHELSLVRNMFDVIATAHREVPLESITRIHLQVGELANVEPLALHSAFQAFVETAPQYQHITLVITQTPVMIYCEACGKNSPVLQYNFVCACGRPSSQIVQGLELLVKEIEYEEIT